MARSARLPSPIRALLVVALLYAFLVGVKMLESGIKGIGSDYTDPLFASVSNPLAGLFVGILATVLVQSSSVTTATIVGLVASGVVGVEAAVPMIMGANIGTTVTNTLVSLTNARRSEQFRLAFTAATMHDFFNVLVVIVLLPLEVFTGFLHASASWIAGLFVEGNLGGSFDSPVKAAVGWLANLAEGVIETIIASPVAAAIVTIAVAIGVIFVTLTFITKNMRALVADRIEASLNAALAKSGTIGIVVGMLVTIAVQSSSITTSILIPLVASGLLMVRNAYPITLGANIGTTITALLAAMAAGSIDGLTIAFTHTLFNVLGIMLVYPWPRVRYIPVVLAERLANVAVRSKSLAVAYTFGAFVVIPFLGILVLR
ncbi:MAG: Na/Pi symporter [Acidimicrobiia bacterium]|nr:Na/Pi symporter [Acidimicrobiia bacterium]